MNGLRRLKKMSRRRKTPEEGKRGEELFLKQKKITEELREKWKSGSQRRDRTGHMNSVRMTCARQRPQDDRSWTRVKKVSALQTTDETPPVRQ